MIQVGDEVIVVTFLDKTLVTIARETKTLWVTSVETRYRKTDNEGAGSSPGHIREIESPEEREEVWKLTKEQKEEAERAAEHQRLWTHFGIHLRHSWSKVPLEKLKQIEAILGEDGIKKVGGQMV